MKEPYKFYLSIGSNIQPEINLPKAIDLLREYGAIQTISNVWESHSLGANGPNFLNACILFLTPINPDEVKKKIIRSIEKALGRVRSKDKNGPRSIDIDIIMVDTVPYNLERWKFPFVVLPMSELAPEMKHPIENLNLFLVADRMSSQTWIKKRPEILKSLI